MATSRLVWSVAEAAVQVGISERFARELIKRGELPARRLGGRVVVPKHALEQWINAREAEAS